jgi:hypothetical protein
LESNGPISSDYIAVNPGIIIIFNDAALLDANEAVEGERTRWCARMVGDKIVFDELRIFLELVGPLNYTLELEAMSGYLPYAHFRIK